MWTIFSYSVRKKLGMIIGWGVGLLLLGLLLISMYDLIAIDAGIDFNQYIDAMPPEMMALFGGAVDFASPAGFLSLEYFSYLPIMLGFVIIGQAGKLFVGLEEEGLLDLYLAYPIRRIQFFHGRILAETAALILLMIFAYIGAVIPLGNTSLGISALEMIEPFLSLFAILFCYLGISVLLTFILPTRSLGVTAGNLFLIISFFIDGFAGVNEKLEPFAKFSPFHYFQRADSIVDGMNWEWFGGLFAVGLAGILVSMVLFERREVRVSGEGSWQLLSFLKKKKSQVL